MAGWWSPSTSLSLPPWVHCQAFLGIPGHPQTFAWLMLRLGEDFTSPTFWMAVPDPQPCLERAQEALLSPGGKETSAEGMVWLRTALNSMLIMDWPVDKDNPGLCYLYLRLVRL